MEKFSRDDATARYDSSTKLSSAWRSGPKQERQKLPSVLDEPGLLASVRMDLGQDQTQNLAKAKDAVARFAYHRVMRRNATHTSSRRVALGNVGLTLIAAVIFLTVLPPATAYAAGGDINTVIDSIRNWVAGILAALATLFLTIGGIRYLIAAGNPRMMDEAKAAIRSAIIGYALAALAPMLVDILRRVIGTA